MKNERKGIDKKKMLKDAKENEELVRFIKSLTKEEIQRIYDARAYDDIKPGTPTHKIALQCDALRRSMRKTKATIDKRVWSIGDLQNKINRLQSQLDSGKITEELKDGITMNEHELTTEIQHYKWTKDGEFYALFNLLAELRGVVGHKDVAKNVILTLEEFDDYVKQLNERVKKFGYDLFEKP